MKVQTVLAVDIGAESGRVMGVHFVAHWCVDFSINDVLHAEGRRCNCVRSNCMRQHQQFIF